MEWPDVKMSCWSNSQTKKVNAKGQSESSLCKRKLSVLISFVKPLKLHFIKAVNSKSSEHKLLRSTLYQEHDLVKRWIEFQKSLVKREPQLCLWWHCTFQAFLNQKQRFSPGFFMELFYRPAMYRRVPEGGASTNYLEMHNRSNQKPKASILKI